MKKLMAIFTVVLMVSSVVSAAIVQRTYTFTGADLINNVFDDTARHSDESLDVYEGMRQIAPSAGGDATGATFLTGGYLTDFNNTWNNAVNNGYVLSQFWLPGSNGNSGQWGEDYKPYEWVSGTGPTGWSIVYQTNSSPAAGSHTDQFPVWWSDSGLALDSTTLDSQIFTVTIKFDTDDMWYVNPNNYEYGCNTAPNGLDSGLTMYFGSYLIGPEVEGVAPINRYVGNMFAVPEPATMVLLGLGSLALIRRKRHA